ncbi:MAG: hypothetical protein IJY89_03645, partial [Clostridia bacterium]|nr:hypothetical protein [Clostridia bacterium]
MHDHRPSQNEELEEILAEYRKKKKEQPEGRQPTPHTETRVVEAKTRVELPKEKPAPVEETEEIGISEDAVKNHFADSVSEEDMGLSSHFSESDGDEPPLPAEEPDLPAEEEEDEEDEEDEDELQLPLPLRILRKLW